MDGHRRERLRLASQTVAAVFISSIRSCEGKADSERNIGSKRRLGRSRSNAELIEQALR